MSKLRELRAMLLFIASLIGVIYGALAVSDGVGWAWFVLGPAAVILVAMALGRWRALDPFAGPSAVYFATREQWAGIRGFVSGFALAVAIWAGMTDSVAGRVIAAICVAVIGLCVFAGSYGRGR